MEIDGSRLDPKKITTVEEARAIIRHASSVVKKLNDELRQALAELEEEEKLKGGLV
jgi:hypothetical protein